MSGFQRMIRSYTGAEIELSREELARLEERCNELVVANQWWFWVMMLLTVSSTAVIAALSGRFLGPVAASATGLGKPICAAGCAMVAAVISITIWLYGYSFLYIRPARRALTELGYEVCVKCGYFLGSIAPASERCPECGTIRSAAASSAAANGDIDYE